MPDNWTIVNQVKPSSVLELRPGDGLDDDAIDRVPVVGFNLSGTRPPLVCLRAWRRNIGHYSNLAKALGPDQPIYTASPPHGKVESDFPRDTEAWAEHYFTTLGSLMDLENLILGGWSYSGVIALHMAEQLAAEGRPPLLINLFDSIMPVAKPRGDSRKRTGFHKFVVKVSRGMEISDSQDRKRYFVEYAKNQAGKFTRRRRWEIQSLGRRLLGHEPKLDPVLARKRLKATAPIEPLKKAVRVAYLKTRPAISTLPVALYWTEQSRGRLGDSSLGWCMRMKGEFRCHPVAGVHTTLFEPVNVGSLSAALSTELEMAAKRALTPAKCQPLSLPIRTS